MTTRRTRKGPARAARNAPSARQTTRTEFDRIRAELEQRDTIISGLVRNQEIQFKRIAQLQVEIDELRRALAGRRRPVSA